MQPWMQLDCARQSNKIVVQIKPLQNECVQSHGNGLRGETASLAHQSDAVCDCTRHQLAVLVLFMRNHLVSKSHLSMSVNTLLKQV